MKKIVFLVIVLVFVASCKDSKLCESARNDASVASWKAYLAQFPDGKCADEAKAVLEKEEEKACSEARKENTRASWEKYLKIFSDGKCAEEGNSVRNKFTKVGGFEWSDISDVAMKWIEIDDEPFAGSYCRNLREGGHSDWRLPDIDELRLLVQNHPGTAAGGKCRISAENDERIDDESEGDDDICEGIEGEKFSKLGDKDELWSSSLSDTCRTVAYRSINFINGGILSTHVSNDLYVRCVRKDDSDACEEAMEKDSYESWENYLSLFPNGNCSKEARAALEDAPVCKRVRKQNTQASWEFYLGKFPKGKCVNEAKDAVCEKVKKQNTRAAWEHYLKTFPDGKCVEEGKAVRNKFRRIGNYEWSDIIGAWDVSCEELVEDGHDDWREPNIDELRVLVQNHPGTVAGGACKIYEKDSIEVNRKFDKIDEEAAARFNFENCYGVESGNFSKLGDKGWLDSSSVSGEGSFCGIIGKTYFSISFDNGKLSPDGRFGRTRCVRQDDQDACETAKKYNTIYYWNFYIENFPEGKCSAEAKKAVDKLSCEEARKENSSYDWENYLKEFPEGQCAAEAKAFLDKEAAKEDSESK